MDEATAIIVRQLQTDTRDARSDIAEAKLTIAKLWTEHRELTTTVQGAQGDNGLRSDVRALEEWRARVEQHLTGLDSRLQHYLDVERVNTCHGIAALDDHLEKHKEWEDSDMRLKESNISARAVILAAVIPSGVSAVVTIIATLIATGVLG